MKNEEFATARKAMNDLKANILEKLREKIRMPHIKAVANSSFFILHSSFLIACTGGTLLHSYKPLPAEGWDRCDTVCFDLPRAEKDIDGTLFIGLRTKANVGFQDIVLAVEQFDEIAGLARCDTVRYPLADAEGYALTPGVNHHQYETQQLPIHLNKGQSGSVRIHHLMTHEVISGITEVGIKINQP